MYLQVRGKRFGQRGSAKDSAMPDEHYRPCKYWNRLIGGDGSLSNVGYAALGEIYNKIGYRVRLIALKRALAGLGLGKTSVFEAAFGEGFYLRFWRAKGVRKLAGIDISKRAVARAKSLYPTYTFRCGDLSRPSEFEGLGVYDVVTAIDVLYHITDDRRWATALSNLLGIVATDGIFLFTDAFPASKVYQRFPHVRRRPFSMWTQELGKSGFRVVRRVPVFLLMGDSLTCANHPWVGRVCMFQWRLVSKALRVLHGFPHLRDLAATVLGLCQYIPETLAVSMAWETPSLQLVVCARRRETAKDEQD